MHTTTTPEAATATNANTTRTTAHSKANASGVGRAILRATTISETTTTTPTTGTNTTRDGVSLTYKLEAAIVTLVVKGSMAPATAADAAWTGTYDHSNQVRNPQVARQKTNDTTAAQ